MRSKFFGIADNLDPAVTFGKLPPNLDGVTGRPAAKQAARRATALSSGALARGLLGAGRSSLTLMV